MHQLNPEDIQLMANGEVRIKDSYWSEVQSDRVLYASLNELCNNHGNCDNSSNQGCANVESCEGTMNTGNCTEYPPIGP